jgi:dipeptidyl aminopeptidase/acylaminoacyl peptidase
MTTDRQLEQRLPGMLEELYLGPMPAYRDHVLEATARTPQRPAWTFLGRWLPIIEQAQRVAVGAHAPWRSIALVMLVAALTLALLAALIGGSRPRLPAPFGPARTGLVAYASDGDIYTADAATGATRPIVTGPETDLDPRWSRDGARLAFMRQAAGAALIFVTDPDGSNAIQITPEPLRVISNYAFSPTGAEMLINTELAGVPTVLLAATDGSGVRELDIGRPATQGAWRPPDGREILFMDAGTWQGGFGGIHAVSPLGGPVRTIVEPVSGRFRDLAAWSPDGTRVGYMEWFETEGFTSRIHVVEADGTGDRVLPMPAEAHWEVFRGWSNDGTRILAIRGYTPTWEGSVAVVRPPDDSGFGVEIADARIREGSCCSVWEWAPDDSMILGIPTDQGGVARTQVLVDPLTGTVAEVPWGAISDPAWQRLPD